ncbi:MAG: hypothetical protein GY781_21805 [Gammaproteobacteria bacterium]|nr:hypothetical protein [Gammaproteobacteria bacterium]
MDISKIDIKQLIKLVVYTLLLINFVFYIRDDWVIAAHTMRNGGSFLDWTAAFATTIDESAWILLLLLFELETYVLSDEPLPPVKAFAMHTIRLVCYVSLTHTIYAYSIAAYDVHNVAPIAGINNLCQLAGDEISFAYNLLYTELDAQACTSLSSSTQFFYIDPPENIVVTGAAGLEIEQQLAYVDIIEAITWLVILLAIEMTVRLQERGISKGQFITILNRAKFMLYSVLWLAIFYWSYRGHYMFAWDEFVWIAGFVAIEMNVVEWRNEMEEAENGTDKLVVTS